MAKIFKNLTLEQREKLTQMLSNGASINEIANEIGCHASTIYREIKRGQNDDGVYDPYYAEKNRIANRAKSKQNPILLKNKELAQEIASFLIYGEGSVGDAITVLSAKGFDMPSRNTIYAAIDRGLIPGVTRETLRKNQAIIFNGGYVHIPKWMQKDLGWTDGDKLVFKPVEEDSILIKLAK